MKKLFDELPYLENENIIIRVMVESDAEALNKLKRDKDVYRYIPTYLYEQKYEDGLEVIKRMKAECFDKKEQMLLGTFLKESDGEKSETFCGISEFYDYSEEERCVSLGGRYMKEYWGHGIAPQVVKLMTDYLFNETDVEIIKMSIMSMNSASIKAIEKTGFKCIAREVPCDWGYEEYKPTDKWEMRKF